MKPNYFIKRFSQLSVLLIMIVAMLVMGNNVSNAQTTFASLSAADSGGSGFKTVSTNSNIVVSIVLVNAVTEMYHGSANGQNGYTVGPFSIVAYGVTDFTFEGMNFNAFTDLVVNAANSIVIFKNASGNVIQTMTLNNDKGMRAGTNTSFASFFDNGTALPISNVRKNLMNRVHYLLYSFSYSLLNLLDNKKPTIIN